MKSKTTTRVDVMFRAFSDRTRLRILHLLTGGELCVCDLVDVLGVPQPKASRHLAYLRKAGLVVTRKDGYWSYYQLAPPRNPFHVRLLDCLACCFEDAPELAKDAKRLAARVHCCK
jgi:ArsR family transcriptional regulator, arsenate/arsenite/antimonite-responsive transcriptional repressor